jgi:hypothetical protein
MKTINASQSPWLPSAGISSQQPSRKVASEMIMPLRISAVRVVPMKIPSSKKPQTETIGEATSQGR